MLNNDEDFYLNGFEKGKSGRIGKQTSIAKSAIRQEFSNIGNNVKIFENVKIEQNAIVGDNCIIDANTIIKNSIIMDNTYIGSDLEIVDKIVFGNNLIDPKFGEKIQMSDEFL